MSMRRVQQVGVMCTIGVLWATLVVVLFYWPSSSSTAKIAPAPALVITLPYHVPVRHALAAFSF